MPAPMLHCRDALALHSPKTTQNKDFEGVMRSNSHFARNIDCLRTGSRQERHPYLWWIQIAIVPTTDHPPSPTFQAHLLAIFSVPPPPPCPLEMTLLRGHAGKQVLIIEENLNNREVALELRGAAQLVTEAARNGVEAVL